MEMETVNTGIIGSLKPITTLMDKYANNTEARKRLITELLQSNPLDPNTDFEVTGKGNNNKVADSLLEAMGAGIVLDDKKPVDTFEKALINLPAKDRSKFIDAIAEDASNTGYEPSVFYNNMTETEKEEYLEKIDKDLD